MSVSYENLESLIVVDFWDFAQRPRAGADLLGMARRIALAVLALALAPVACGSPDAGSLTHGPHGSASASVELDAPSPRYAAGDAVTVRLDPAMAVGWAQAAVDALDDWNVGPGGAPLFDLRVEFGSRDGADIFVSAAAECHELGPDDEPFFGPSDAGGQDGAGCHTREGGQSIVTVWAGLEDYGYDLNNPDDRRPYKLLAHEIGHALGLDHPHGDEPSVMAQGAAATKTITDYDRHQLWALCEAL